MTTHITHPVQRTQSAHRATQGFWPRLLEGCANLLPYLSTPASAAGNLKHLLERPAAAPPKRTVRLPSAPPHR